MGVGKNITQFRQERGMTQKELADLAIVHVSYLAAIEEEKKNPHVKTLARIASCLGVTIEDLMNKGDDQEDISR